MKKDNDIVMTDWIDVIEIDMEYITKLSKNGVAVLISENGDMVKFVGERANVREEFIRYCEEAGLTYEEASEDASQMEPELFLD